MRRQIGAGLSAGVLLLVLDGVINANPVAQRLYAAYEPIARPSVNALVGSVVDLVYGVILAAVFVRLRPSLPGAGGIAKGLSFGLLLWFLRVVMRVASEWVTTTVPASTHAYTLLAGLAQMLMVAVFIAYLLPARNSERAP